MEPLIVSTEVDGDESVEPFAGLLKAMLTVTKPPTFCGFKIGMVKVLVTGSPWLKKRVPETAV